MPSIYLKDKHIERTKEETHGAIGETVDLQKEPRVTLSFFLSRHNNEEDLEGFESAFKDADVLMIEVLNWMPNTEDIYNRISMGNVDKNDLSALDIVRQSTNPAFQYALIKKLYGSKKTVIFPDVPGNHELAQRISVSNTQLREAINRYRTSLLSGKLDEAVAYYREWLDLSSQIQQLREDFIRYRIRSELKALKRYPKFRGKDEIKVLQIIGAGHSSLVDILKKDGVAVATILPESNDDEPLEVTILRKRINEEEILDELCTRAMIENILQSIVWSVEGRGISHSERSLLDNLTLGDINDLALKLAAESDVRRKIGIIFELIVEKDPAGSDV